MASVNKSYHFLKGSIFKYHPKDAILYALSVGAEKKNLQYLYEKHEKFRILPTFIVSPCIQLFWLVNDWPGIDFDSARIVHGEHYIEFFNRLPSDQQHSVLYSEIELVDILDKGSGAFIAANVNSFDSKTGKKIALQQLGLFQLGSGNFGGARSSTEVYPIANVPQRAPDKSIEQSTSNEQAIFYRLASGDMNPLHIDDKFAKKAGFNSPILHGLCSLGFSARHILEVFGDSDVDRIKSVKARFTSPVFPGQTLVTEMWKEADRIHFQTKIKETEKIAIANAYVDLQPSFIPNISALNIADSIELRTFMENIRLQLPKYSLTIPLSNGLIILKIMRNYTPLFSIFMTLNSDSAILIEGQPKVIDKIVVEALIDIDDFIKIPFNEKEYLKVLEAEKLQLNGMTEYFNIIQMVLESAWIKN